VASVPLDLWGKLAPALIKAHMCLQSFDDVACNVAEFGCLRNDSPCSSSAAEREGGNEQMQAMAVFPRLSGLCVWRVFCRSLEGRLPAPLTSKQCDALAVHATIASLSLCLCLSHSRTPASASHPPQVACADRISHIRLPAPHRCQRHAIAPWPACIVIACLHHALRCRLPTRL
jgi:hypothetical protein